MPSADLPCSSTASLLLPHVCSLLPTSDLADALSQLTFLALFYGPTTPSGRVQSTAYQPPSRCLQLTCLAIFYDPTIAIILVRP